LGAQESILSSNILHPRSSHCAPEELRVEARSKDPSMEEAKRCELKLPFKIKRTARIRFGGRVPTGAIASRNPVEGEKAPTPVPTNPQENSLEISPRKTPRKGSENHQKERTGTTHPSLEEPRRIIYTSQRGSYKV
jgi:hypothetical protein